MAIADDLVSYYKLDEASGDADDAEGTNDGSVTGATYGATGKLNDCYSFDGSGDYVSIPYTADLDSISAFTFTAWVKLTDWDDNSSGVIVAKSNSAGNNDYLFYKRSSNVLRILADNLTPSFIDWDVSSFVNANWYHVAATYDGSELILYVNGSSVVSDDVTGTITDNEENTGIGARVNATPDLYFDGLIDEVGMWSRALTSTEISSLYNSGSGLAYPFTAGEINPKIKAAGSFSTKPIKYKTGGAFAAKVTKVKVSGSF